MNSVKVIFHSESENVTFSVRAPKFRKLSYELRAGWMIAARFLLSWLCKMLISSERQEISAWDFKHVIFIHKTAHWQSFRVVMTGKQIKNRWWILCFWQCEKNVFCDYSQSSYMIAVQLTQDLSKSWMVVHAKFQKISWNISIATTIWNFWVGRLVRVVALF